MATTKSTELASIPRRTAQDAQAELQCFYSILHDRVQVIGGKIYINLPLAQGKVKPYLLVPARVSEDMVYSWATEQYAERNPEKTSPPKASYLAAREKIKFEADIPAQTEPQEKQKKGEGIAVTSSHKVAGTSSLYVTDMGIGYIKADKEGNETWTELWSKAQTPSVHRRLKVHDAYEGAHTLYDMTIGHERHTIPVGLLKSGKWVDLFSDVEGAISPKNHGTYVDAISTIAASAPLVHAPQTTGFFNLGDEEKREYIYLLPDGRYITASGQICKDERVTLAQDILSPHAQELWETLTIPTKISPRAQAAYFQFLKDLSPKAVLIAGHGVRALTSAIRTPQWGAAHTMTILGTQGSGKSALAGMGRGLWPYREKILADGSFADTVTSIENDLSGLRSFPAIVDDLTSQMCGTHALALSEGTKADRLARAVHDEKPPRRRMTASMQRQKSNLIQTCFYNTWEVAPVVPASFWRRTILLTLKPGDVAIDGRSGRASLQDIETHWGAQVYTFCQVIVHTLRELNTHGLQKVADLHHKMHTELEKYLRPKALKAWEQQYPGIDLPPDHHNLIKLYAHELLGLKILDRTSGMNGLADYSMPALLEALVNQFSRLAGIVEDEEGIQLFERALLQLMEEIAQGKRVDGYIWRIDRRVSSTGKIEPPSVVTQSGYILPHTSFGWDDSSSEYLMYKPVIYMDEDNETGCIYLTQDARKALLAIIQKLPNGEAITSEVALGKLAETEGWIKKRQDGKRRTYTIAVPQGSPRTWALSMKKYLVAHYGDMEMPSEEEEQPENVTPIRRAEPGQAGRAIAGQSVSGSQPIATKASVAIAEPPRMQPYDFLINEDDIPEVE